MALFNPSSQIDLISNVPIDNTYRHTIDFSTAEEQHAYFVSKASGVMLQNNYTYLRPEHSIKIHYKYDSLLNINYVMYRNNVGKWIYCFVVRKEYVNESMTKLYLQTDVLQTYMFDYQVGHSFIDREHRNRWTVGGMPILNLVDENLSYGDEYLKTAQHEIYEVDSYNNTHGLLWFLVVATEALEGGGVFSGPIQSSPTPLHYYLVPFDPSHPDCAFLEGTEDYFMSAQRLCDLLSENMNVVSVSFVPYLPFDTIVLPYDSELDERAIFFSGKCDIVQYTWNEGQSTTGLPKINSAELGSAATRTLATYGRYDDVEFPSSFATGLARNYIYESKLLTFPYFYFMLTDFQSTPLIIKNEYLDSDNIPIKVTQALSHLPKTKYFVNGYKGETDGKANCVVNSTVNDLPLKTDAYKNYMMNNKASATSGMALSLLNSGAALGIGVATGGLGLALTANTALNSFSTVFGEVAKRKDLQNVPDSLRNAGNNISFDIADKNTRVKLIQYEIPEKFKRLLADFWNMYGYKCNDLRVPNTKSRYYYNYIKTIGANITGNFDQADLETIRSIYDNGVTFWHYHATGFSPVDYTYENIEVNLL